MSPLQKSPIKETIFYSAKKSYNFKEPTNRSHPIALRDLGYLGPLLCGACACKKEKKGTRFKKGDLKRNLPFGSK